MQDTEEIWKDVVGYEGLYQVSSIGRVKSLPRNGTTKLFKILKPGLFKGYYGIHLSRHNKIKVITVHRMMGFAFMMDSYFEGAQINHLNGIKTCNLIDNFKWVTASENIQHAHDSGLCKPAKYWLGKTGNHHHTSKPIMQFDLHGKFIKEYISATFAAKENAFNRQHISQCCSGTRQQSNGFIWRHKQTIWNDILKA